MKFLGNPLLRALLGRVFAISRRTWLLIGAFLFLLLALALWATISLAGWLFGMARDGVHAAPEALRAATTQVEQAMPGVQEKLGDWLPALKPEPPPRDVSGTDPAPVARFPGLVRVLWQRDGEQVLVRYTGRADLAAVIQHHAQAFAAQGYRQNLIVAGVREERHEYLKGDERYDLTFTREEGGLVTLELRTRHLAS